jgi:hypothetical protein
MNSFIEFEIVDAKRFALLARVLAVLRGAKSSGTFPNDDDWQSYFDEEALSHFWWPTEREVHELEQRLLSTPFSERFYDPSLKRPWHFGSMLQMLHDGEFELVSWQQRGNMGRLEFKPLAWPYGGTGALEALIEAFGFRVIRVTE